MSDSVPAFRYALERAGDFELPVVRRGPKSAPTIIFAQPLFEEHNRCRRFFADLGRALAGFGITTALPDLPRTGDHSDDRPFDITLARAAFAAFLQEQPNQTVTTVSLRGGAFLCSPGHEYFALSPVDKGERMLTDLIRGHAVGIREQTGVGFTRSTAEAAWKNEQTLSLTGHRITPETATHLLTANLVAPAATLTIAGAKADIAGPSIWRQSEPEPRPDIADLVAKKLATWMAKS